MNAVNSALDLKNILDMSKIKAWNTWESLYKGQCRLVIIPPSGSKIVIEAPSWTDVANLLPKDLIKQSD